MIGIIGAMEEEVHAITKYMDINNTTSLLDNTLYIGTIEGQDVVVLQGGIGKVNAAICCTLLLENYPDIEYVINIGSAGGLQTSQNVGDVIISSDVIHHDVDVCAFGRKLGEVPGMPLSFCSDETLINTVLNVLKKMDIPAYVGTIVSGDQFVATKEMVDTIHQNFPDALCVEMEAAAIGQTCYKFNKRFIVTRSLSDVFGKGASAIQFDEYLKKASEASAKMCVALLRELSSHA